MQPDALSLSGGRDRCCHSRFVKGRVCRRWNDQHVEAQGEEQKREAENAALAYGLTRPAPCILDAAGGTITSEASRQR